MNLSKRRFLIGTAALFCAPAIVRTDSLMKIWVPDERKIITRRTPIYVEYANEVWNRAGEFTNADGKSFGSPFQSIPQALNVAKAGDSVYVTIPPKMDDDAVAKFINELQKSL